MSTARPFKTHTGVRSAAVLAVALSALLAGCTQLSPVPQGIGTLSVVVDGPQGFEADITVAGPFGYLRELHGSGVLDRLPPGEYTVTATPVSFEGAEYTPAQATLTVTLGDEQSDLAEAGEPTEATITVEYRVVNPAGPVEPPGEPGEPGAPNDPGDPEDPGDPSDPSDPGDPIEPEQPDPPQSPTPPAPPTPPDEPPYGGPDPDPKRRPGATTYHVDCRAGSDSASGTSPDTAFRTLGRLKNLDLAPGDGVSLKRDCDWVGPLRVIWSGTSEWPIIIGSYGTGALPIIRDSSANHVDISGSHVIVQYLHATTTPGTVWTDSKCQNQPVAWRTGFTFQGSARHVTLRNSRADGNTAGVHLTRGSSFNRVINNDLVDNVIMSVNSDNGGYDDSGAWGIVLNGSDNEIAYNRFSGNNAWCSYDFGQEGASIEVYEAQRNFIHHNHSVNDTTFTELGGSSSRRAADNTFAYNRYQSDLPKSEFLVVRGAADNFGPTLRTRVFNNTAYLSHSDRSQGVVCHAGCGPDILELRNNVIWAEWKGLYADRPFLESNNIFWSRDGRPVLQFFGSGNAMSSTSRVTDPRLVNATAGDFRLTAPSPAVNAGLRVDIDTSVDAAGISVPQMGAVDIGAFELPGN